MTTQTIPDVQQVITVEAPVERAFDVFTTGFNDWWPRSHKAGTADLATAVLELRAGGRWYEIGADGTESEWGRVLAYEPPHRLLLSWEIIFGVGHVPDRASEVEVLFTADGADRTRVELTHRGLDVYGDDAARMQAAVSGDNGWGVVLESFIARF